MKDIYMIAAIGQNRELGYKNDLIWHIKVDMKFFRKMTTGHPIIMGRKTFESLPRLLPNREHIVLSHQNLEIPDVKVYSRKEELDAYLNELEEIPFIIGGASLYKMYLLKAKKIFLTEIQESHVADVYFPEFLDYYDKNTLCIGQENNINYVINEYVLKRELQNGEKN